MSLSSIIVLSDKKKLNSFKIWNKQRELKILKDYKTS